MFREVGNGRVSMAGIKFFFGVGNFFIFVSVFVFYSSFCREGGLVSWDRGVCRVYGGDVIC